MYSPLNEEFMFMEAKQRADSMRGLRGDRLTRRATPRAQVSRRDARGVRRWWHRAAVLAG
jgi:hypothetical protein